MLVSILLLGHNHWDLTHARLYELFTHMPNNVEVIVIDNGSTEMDVSGGIAWWAHNMGHKFPIKPIRNTNNEPFGTAFNMAASVAGGDSFVFMSNDVVVSGDFVTPMIEQLSERSLIGNRLIDWDSGWNTRNGKIYPYLEGYLLACSKSVWEELGGFDEQFSPCDFEDVDLSTKAISIGCSLIALDSQFIFHAGAGTLGYTEHRKQITLRNQEKFFTKWEN